MLIDNVLVRSICQLRRSYFLEYIAPNNNNGIIKDDNSVRLSPGAALFSTAAHSDDRFISQPKRLQKTHSPQRPKADVQKKSPPCTGKRLWRQKYRITMKRMNIGSEAVSLLPEEKNRSRIPWDGRCISRSFQPNIPDSVSAFRY